MKISVKLFAFFTKTVSETIRNRHPDGIRAGIPFEVELPEGSTLAYLVDYLALPREQVKVTFVNGRAKGLDYPLKPEDEVGIFPPIAGG
jgi:molybdopterin converting factor small subunit